MIWRAIHKGLRFLAVISLSLSAALPTETAEPETTGKAADTRAEAKVFLELHLSPDGVYGVDSQGVEWEYDFSRDEFVPGGRMSSPDIPRIEIIPPIMPHPDSFLLKAERQALDAEKLVVLSDSLRKELESSVFRKIRGLQLGTVEIGPEEIIIGPLVAVGPITVKGTVKGDVISYRKITVTSSGEITGDARAPEIVKMRGAIIGGSEIETDLPKIPEIEIFDTTSDTALIANLIILAVLLFCGLLAVAIVPNSINRVEKCLQTYFVRSFFIGFAAWFLLGPVFALLCLTIIGIPVAIFVLPLALVLGVILGTIGLGQFVGQALGRVLSAGINSQLLRIVFGTTVLYIPWIIMSI
ncbi:MAG: polymer-forming cytoskeletal protein, partial [bacterium]